MAGFMKGYDIKTISKKKLDKEGFGEGLSEAVAIEQLKAEILEVLENEGFVYGLYKKKEMVACYMIERHEGEAPEQENVDAPIMKDKKHKNDVLTLTKEYILPGHDRAVLWFDDAVLDSLKERITFYGDAARIEFRDQVLTEKTYNVGGFNIGGAMLGFVIGFLLFGVAMDNYALGICLGLAFASSYGIMFSSKKDSVVETKDDEVEQEEGGIREADNTEDYSIETGNEDIANKETGR
ncbi:MAG: hypothetical protein IJ661_12690 [Lachnospiraceae bacterium]|nr:hypothetical protein [Lachnospiraceae bacterium]